MGRKTDKIAVDPAAWDEAVAREAVIRPLVQAGRIPARELFLACRRLGLKRSRLYELIQRYRATPVTSSLVGQAPGPDDGGARLPAETETAIAEALEKFYRSREKPSVSALRRRLAPVCKERGLPLPCWSTLRKRIDKVDPRVLVRDREGSKAARDRFAAVPRSYSAAHALEIVQVDHTPVDLIIVDPVHRLPIGRPWLTLAIDLASRMVAGFHLTLEPPSAASVALAIHHMVMPKEPWLAGRDIAGVWPVAGLPDAIHLDNAKEFRSRALNRGAEEYGIALLHRPVATPHYGGHIERLIGTMMGAVHLLPGTTFSNVADRGAYDSEARAVLTLAELERWLALEIIGRYHADRHCGLGTPPIAAWGEAVAARPAPIRAPHDANQFLFDFLPFETRIVRRDGIRLFGLRYWDDVLSPWAGRLDRALRVKYDPRDLSIVFVEGPDLRHWPIRFADLGRPPITLAEHRRASALLRERGVRLVDEQLLFETIEEQRTLVDAATKQTKLARRQASRRDAALQPAATRMPRKPDTDDAPNDDARFTRDLPYFPVEEWS